MEFYPSASDSARCPNGFQFPTGWNSTQSLKAAQIARSIVSIPNGMEFYKANTSKLKPFMRFSSQRDGILRNGYFKLYRIPAFQFPTGWNSTIGLSQNIRWISNVSIPNGMEFYAKANEIAVFTFTFQFPTGWNSTSAFTWALLCFVCFNSQRDGILRSRSIRRNGSFAFQFPTGWNSTKTTVKTLQTIRVSIPNGMEFYQELR